MKLKVKNKQKKETCCLPPSDLTATPLTYTRPFPRDPTNPSHPTTDHLDLPDTTTVVGRARHQVGVSGAIFQHWG